MYPSITVSNDAAKRLAAGRLWFARSDVVGRKPNIPGIVNLVDRRGRSVGMAFLSPGSQYYLRVFSKSKQKTDKMFWRERIVSANDRRSSFLTTTDAYRVVHAEADGIPAVIIDRYNDIWAIQITASGAMTIAQDLIDIIVQEFAPAAIVEKNSSQSRSSEGVPKEDRIIFGDRSDTVIRELDQRFEVDVLAGQKTGAYLDYRAFRIKAREFVHGLCLDAFCYQGWFSCQIASKAANVISVDGSSSALAAAKRNAQINGHDNIEFVKADVLDYLKKCKREFDFIHLDPPSFSKGAGGRVQAMAGYSRLITSAARLTRRGGVMMVSSCSHAVTEGMLERAAVSALKKLGFDAEVLFSGIQDRDHPVRNGHPESLYLKAIALSLTNS